MALVFLKVSATYLDHNSMIKETHNFALTPNGPIRNVSYVSALDVPFPYIPFSSADELAEFCLYNITPPLVVDYPTMYHDIINCSDMDSLLKTISVHNLIHYPEKTFIDHKRQTLIDIAHL